MTAKVVETQNQKPRTCGLVMPISAIGEYTEKHWADVADILKESLADTEFTVELVSDANDIGVIQKRIVQNLYDSDLIVCDVSAKNPNVMFELGMRLAFDKPEIIVKDELTSYSFDTAPIEHLIYPRSLHYQSMQAFKKKLRDKAIATFEASLKPAYTTFLKHFGEFVVASIDAKPISKDDFLLREIGDLRREVAELARSYKQGATELQRGDLPRYFHKEDPVFDYEVPAALKKVWDRKPARARTLVSVARQFLINKQASPTDLANPDSENFKKLQYEFTRDLHGTDAITADRYAAIVQALVEAGESLE